MDRKFVDDGWDLAIAVKQGELTLYNNFQEYWQKRCRNNGYLSVPQTYGVLQRFAVDNFERADWAFFMRRIADDSVIDENLFGLISTILSTIQMMQMVFEDKEA